MSEKYKFRNPDGIYFITPTLVYWVDLFSKKAYCEVILESLIYCQKEKGLVIHAWCIMSSHLHLIVSRKNTETLPSIVRDFKKYTSIKLIETIRNTNESRRDWLLNLFHSAAHKLKRNKKYKVWQDGNHPVELASNKMIHQRLNYLHKNPVKAGIVDQIEHYHYSSAKNYCGEQGPLSIVELL